jgi:hypothetical protein
VRSARPTIQRMHSCSIPNCMNGELCGGDANFGGLFKVPAPKKVGAYKHVRKDSLKGQREAEHMLSGQMAKEFGKLTGKTYNYDEMPAYTIDYDVHQQGRYGIGGGISSTGSSATSKRWSKHVADQLHTNPKEGIRSLIADELNAHQSQGKLDDTIVAAVLATAAEVIKHFGLTVSGSDWEYLVSFAYSYI